MQIKLNSSKLSGICKAEIDDFRTIEAQALKKDRSIIETTEGILIHQSNNSKVLAVAHLDTVQEIERHFFMSDTLIFSPQLDDRLGAYIILELLPALGIKTDILLTEGEESGCSTAAFFKTDKEYNWIFSFDRSGTDVVLYEYENKRMRKLLRRVGLKVGQGSFSDISYLNHLGVKGFNFGCAYYDYHSINSYAKIKELKYSIGCFIKFFNRYAHLKLEHDHTQVSRYSHFSSYDDGYHLDNLESYHTHHTHCQYCNVPLWWKDEEEYGVCILCANRP